MLKIRLRPKKNGHKYMYHNHLDEFCYVNKKKGKCVKCKEQSFTVIFLTMTFINCWT